MNNFGRFFTAIGLFFLMATFAACEKTFDAPPGPYDPNITANMTIDAFKSLHTTAGGFTEIDQDIIISGIVVANDKSGNMYKQLFIQDTTGAIQLQVNATNLYTSYPVGRRVFIRAKGLTLTDEARTMILGYKDYVNGAPSVEGIPSALVSNYIIGGSIGNAVVPFEVTFNDLGTSMSNRYVNALIKLKDYEFSNADTTKTYSDTSQYRITTNLNLQNCSSSSIILRTSAYANFAGIKVPRGNGDITCIYTLYNTTRQLLIRDTTDVQFYSFRCNETPPPAGTLISENFETQTVPPTGTSPVTITGWLNMAEAGPKVFNAKVYQSNKYAEISCFASNAANSTAWLVTPAINLDNTTNERLSFDTKQGYIGTGGIWAAGLKVLISTDFTGTGNPWAATWTDLSSQAAFSPGAATTYPTSFTNSGNISIAGYSGTVYIAFKYEGADPTGTDNDRTSTWQIDNIQVIGD
ncbi:MAG: choice-of-anchor J domain-containing protein [Ferruginibacter sp.]|nr:choice-of-anchor J domain-containing protein [Ferruginibacter sp.]